MTALALAGLLGLGAVGLVFYFKTQAEKAEQNLLRSKNEYIEMQRTKKVVEQYIRNNKGNKATAKEDVGDMLTYLDRKARDSSLAPGSFTVAKNATATVGNWLESSYTVTLQSEKKESPIKRGPVVDFLARVEKDRRSAKSKSIQLTFAGEDFKTAIIGFSQFMPK